MKPALIYTSMFFGVLLLLGLLGGFLVLSQSGVGVRAYIEAMRYMSIGGKVALALFLAGTFYFLLEFILAPGRK